MLYKPNYCCNCGEKIERIEWHLWTNRRFCQLCQTEYQLDDWLKRIFPIIFFAVGIFGIGSYFQSSEKVLEVGQQDKNIVSPNADSRKNAQPRTLKSSVVPKEQSVGQVEKTTRSESATPMAEPQTVERVSSPQKSSDGTVFFCGATTKKGSPCSRRVKGGGRCWQHKGKEAMLSAKDLLVEQN